MEQFFAQAVMGGTGVNGLMVLFFIFFKMHQLTMLCQILRRIGPRSRKERGYMVKLLNFLTSFCLVNPLNLLLGYIKGFSTWSKKGKKDTSAMLLNVVITFYCTH